MRIRVWSSDVCSSDLAEEGAPQRHTLRWIGQDADRAYIPTGAEGALAGAADQHRIDSRIVLPVGQDRIELLDHGEVDRVERLGPIEGDHPQRPWVAVSTSRADSSTDRKSVG